MTVWAKLQSWLGASASDVAIDNEFNNIYLGLNEAANGNLPSGYNKVGLTFTGASLTIKGETKIGNVNVNLDSTLTVSGAAGWRYIVTTNGGVMSVESIPPAEITADTQVYTPTPVFNVVNNGYYSTVNTARRIIGICYFDTTIKEVIAYGTGKTRNDDFWLGMSGMDVVSGVNTRLQFTAAFAKSCGSNIAMVDNGAGSDDTFGLRVTSLKQQKLNIFGTVLMSGIGGTSNSISIHKNGVLYIADIAQYNNSTANAISVSYGINFTDPLSQVGDYYTFVITGGGVVNTTLTNIGATNV
jgi:hypothetical protein